ncbi:hypothetical protein Q7P37_006171 [Cladosporium fusiforme]
MSGGKSRFDWRGMMGRKAKDEPNARRPSGSEGRPDARESRLDKWSLGVLNDKETDEVPGTVLLMSNISNYNEPLGVQNTPARRSASSLPSHHRRPSSSGGSVQRRRPSVEDVKYTKDGKFVLEPQPTESANDPLNWPIFRRDLALISLGFYCMIGGGMTPILAAGFSQVSRDLDVSVPDVALTTGLYMMGLGLGSVVLSPTAILYGKRPVYLIASVCFLLSNIWCAVSHTFVSLLVARIFQGFAVSSVECLPSASIAEIYFLHEKAYRLGIYTLLLLGGKNLVPLISAIIINSLGWRWVFWIVAIIIGFSGLLLFLFVPETFWDRAPVPRRRHPSRNNLNKHHRVHRSRGRKSHDEKRGEYADAGKVAERHAHFGPDEDYLDKVGEKPSSDDVTVNNDDIANVGDGREKRTMPASNSNGEDDAHAPGNDMQVNHSTQPGSTTAPRDQNDVAGSDVPKENQSPIAQGTPRLSSIPSIASIPASHSDDIEQQSPQPPSSGGHVYTKALRSSPTKSFSQQLKLWNGRLSKDKWWRVAIRPLFLFAYPSILWSALVYALSIGWLIVLSECVGHIYEDRDSYNFTAMQVGLVYISPFIGGIIGTAIAGKVSDIVVRYMARRNGGIYEPEFRLVLVIPIAISTVAGLMGFGWSVEERNNWIVPTVFFGIISFGCSLGSTISISFAVDSYRQYAGEALVTLNFSKNILHGLVWSLFFNRWLEDDGSKLVFNAIGGIQLACMLTTIPMYIYGKRCRMWTVRRNLMEKF